MNEARSNSYWKMHVYGQISSYANPESWVVLQRHKANVEELLATRKLLPPGVTQLVMFPHLPLTFFHPSFNSPPATAARSATHLCPVISCYSSFLGKEQGRSETTPSFLREQPVSWGT